MKSQIPATVESAESKPKFKIPKQYYDLVEIWWLDTSAQDLGWKSKIEKTKPVLAHSVGFLVHSDDDHYIIAMDVDTADNEHNQRSQIPKGMVKHWRLVRKHSKLLTKKKEESNDNLRN